MLAEGTLLENRYRIDGLIAEGGMGAIYLGFDVKLDISVAIKENFMATSYNVEQFQQEARILARLQHQSLPRVIDHFSFDGQQYLVMDFIEGQDLWDIVKAKQSPLTEAQALDYIKQICQAVYYLHQQEPPIIHRDIKPQNIKVTPKDRAVLVDFGIAKIATEDNRTQTGARGITPGFSPPEQYSGSGTTPASDIYALGATLYALLTGKKPPDSISVLSGEVAYTPPDQLNKQLSSLISQAITHAMQPRATDRPVSVTAWLEELAEAEQALANSLTQVTEATADGQSLPETVLTVGWLIGPTGRSYPIKLGSLTFGRAKQSDVVVNDQLASRYHAVLEFDGQQCRVYDEGSGNGTFVNDERVGSEGHPFRVGDQLRIGETVFTLSATEPPPIQPEPPPEIINEHTPTGIFAGSSPPAETPSATPWQKNPSWFMVALLFVLIIVVSFYLVREENEHDDSESENVAAMTVTPVVDVVTPTVNLEATPAPIAEVTEPAAIETSTPTTTPTPTETPTDPPTATFTPVVVSNNPPAANCPAWYVTPEPGRSVLVIENHTSQELQARLIESNIDVDFEEKLLSSKQEDVPGRVSYPVVPAGYTFHLIRVDSNTPWNKLELNIEPNKMFVVSTSDQQDMTVKEVFPLTDIPPGCPNWQQ